LDAADYYVAQIRSLIAQSQSSGFALDAADLDIAHGFDFFVTVCNEMQERMTP
jgi:hypothetical protein